MPIPSVPTAGETRVVRATRVPDLADAGVWLGTLDGAPVAFQELNGEIDAVQGVIESLAESLPGPNVPTVGSCDGTPVVLFPLPAGEWLSTLLDPRRRRVAPPPRAVCEVGVRVAGALDFAWADGVAPPPVRLDARAVALRVAPDAGLSVGALRFTGGAPREMPDGRGPVPGDDTRGEDLFLLGALLYQMATRRRFGPGGTTPALQRHHFQRRLTAAAAELDAFLDQRQAFVDLLHSLVGPDRDAELPFSAVTKTCQALLDRLPGDGFVEWAALAFPTPAAPVELPGEVAETRIPIGPPPKLVPAPPRAGARTASAARFPMEERTPIRLDLVGAVEEPTDLPPQVATTQVEELTEMSPPDAPEPPAAPPAVARWAPPKVLGPPAARPSGDDPMTQIEVLPDDESSDLPENVIPLRGEARPGTRRGGLVPRAGEGSDPSIGRTRPTSSSGADPIEAGPPPRRARFTIGLGILVLVGIAVPTLMLSGIAWLLVNRGGMTRGDLVLSTGSTPELQVSTAEVVRPEPSPKPEPPPVVLEPEVTEVDLAAAPAPATSLGPSPAAPSASPPRTTRTTTPAANPPPLPADLTPPIPPPPLPVPVAAPDIVLAPPVMATFTSKPLGVLVSVDGRPRGTTPLQMLLPTGPHTLSFESDGRVIAREVEVSATDDNRWTLYVGQGKIE